MVSVWPLRGLWPTGTPVPLLDQVAVDLRVTKDPDLAEYRSSMADLTRWTAGM